MARPGKLLQTVPLRDEQSLFTLVENRSAFTMERCELNVFETHRRAEKVNLVFDDLVLTSMLRGKKVMHLFGKDGFEYLPGESVIVPPHEVMRIDFPEAHLENPTQCIALAISAEQIQETVNLLNERFPRVDSPGGWEVDSQMFHLVNNQDLADIINRIVRIGIKDQTREKDVLAGLALRELLVRLMQTQARELIERNYTQLATGNRFAHVVQYIKENLRERINLDTLHEKACMSRANFFRKFKEMYGISPGDYIVQERIRWAKEYLKNPYASITDVCFRSGFQNLHHFIRTFRRVTGVTPSAFRERG
ncbi:MAG: AraC family transcriptional regulator [Cyclobacteriaceae bacterium]|nr:AraC family transcriptional regulator [Cyclobacteriaceae bacterium]